ncbi:MAG: hypothetical protein OEY96_06660 [Gammaproteobacteria bacterium]|nr:hypothetical protein [Gammaproteobacteria bacterium]
MKKILLIIISAVSISASASKNKVDVNPLLLFGISKQHLVRVIKYELNECVDQNASIVTVKVEEFNKVFPLSLSNESEDVELVFNGCDNQSVLREIGITLREQKASMLEITFNTLYGKYSQIESYMKTWNTTDFEIRLLKLRGDLYALSYVSTSIPQLPLEHRHD